LARMAVFMSSVMRSFRVIEAPSAGSEATKPASGGLRARSVERRS